MDSSVKHGSLSSGNDCTPFSLIRFERLNRMIVLRAVFCAFLQLSCSAAVEAESANTFAIKNVRVFDGERTIPVANVVVRDGLIVAVGQKAAIPAGVSVIDGERKTLLPGLIDSHVHVFPGAQADALRFGVTTELDMFDVGQNISKWRAQRLSLAKTKEADTWAAELGVTVKGGAPLQALPSDMQVPTLKAARDAKAFVDARVAEGSDYIKVFIENLSEYRSGKSLPTLTRDEVCAVIQAAHEDRKLAIVHAQAEWAAREAMDCHADGLAHMVPDQIVSDEFIAQAKAQHVLVESTDSVWAGAGGQGLAGSIAKDTRVAPYLSASQKTTLMGGETKPIPAFFTNAVENTRRLHRAGIVLLAGTDAPNPGTAHGISLHEELQLLVTSGFSPAQALRAATALPSTIFHLGNRGHVAVGDRADLVLVSGDPTKRISDSLSIAKIWKNGFAVARSAPVSGKTQP